MKAVDIIGNTIGSNIGLGNAIGSTTIATQQRVYEGTLGRRSGVAEIRITRATNGLIVTFDGVYDTVGETFIAANLKEATDIITAQVASKLLEQT
jgi:hypothetical protein